MRMHIDVVDVRVAAPRAPPPPPPAGAGRARAAAAALARPRCVLRELRR
jgi:hypothetical protein